MPTSPRPIRILTVDDHALLRVGIAALVSGEADMELVGLGSKAIVRRWWLGLQSQEY